MKEEVINQLMEKALNYLNSAEAFVGKEVPIYVQEIMQFKFVEHLLNGSISTLALSLIIGAVFLIMSLLYVEEYPSEVVSKRRFYIMTTLVGLSAGFIIAVAGFRSEFIQAYKAKTAPRVYLIDYVKGK